MGGYIPRPIYRERLFADKSFFPGNIWPAEIVSGGTCSLCSVAEEVLDTAIPASHERVFHLAGRL